MYLCVWIVAVGRLGYLGRGSVVGSGWLLVVARMLRVPGFKHDYIVGDENSIVFIVLMFLCLIH